MKFGIITHSLHKIKDKQIFAYEPYVREMNLWAKYVDEIIIISPTSRDEISSIETAYIHPNIKIIKIPSFDITSLKGILKSLLVIPNICLKLYKVMKQVDHVHLRCPGNIGLLGCFVQVLFPSKNKTVKYAGNWDPNSRQPLSYKIQKRIISNTFLTRNCKVLVYGKWDNQSKNIIPFFTASYSKNEIEEIGYKTLNDSINLLFVGTFSLGKQPLLAVKSAEQLLQKGYDVQLNMYGDGVEFSMIKQYIVENKLSNHISLHGNQPKINIKKAFIESHFLVFISKSEGWPKVVAEAMFWSCLAISTKVSCVPFMLNNGDRGGLLNGNSKEEVVEVIEQYICNKNVYIEEIIKARKWSQEYTLEKFEKEIQKLI